MTSFKYQISVTPAACNEDLPEICDGGLHFPTNYPRPMFLGKLKRVKYYDGEVNVSYFGIFMTHGNTIIEGIQCNSNVKT